MKRHAILDAAKRLFVDNGFEATSVEQIASEAGVSKLTVYSHFGDKETLFFAAVEERCREQLPDDLFEIPPMGPIDQALRTIGHRFHDLLSCSDSVALHRMMLGDARNVERLGTLFWNAGPARIIAGLDAFLHAAVARGELDIPDTREAAGQFLCLLKGEVNLRMLCGPIGCVHGDDADAHVDSVVTLFLRAYRAR
ncbi:TetR/AcrR family transcriptional regulator [Xanthomonadaceae bacterium JHOS43]|nr:TetR/AcrR family transcriptional regulator [Xanthomonadaceae bacterium JHOS43]MCX7562157.1 TetR/AcrR family transcriptional regulator [Xanthomonadaceae bacterium XH05]